MKVHKNTRLDAEVKTPRQKSLMDFQQSKQKLGPERYTKIIRALALTCTLDLRPISMVMGKGFRSFCRLLNPEYRVPCSATVTKHLILIYEEQKGETIEFVSGLDVSITTDLWTSVGSRSYVIVVTAHFITNSCEYKSIVIATSSLDVKHTGQHIADALKFVQMKF